MASIFDNCISSISLPSISKNEVGINGNTLINNFEGYNYKYSMFDNALNKRKKNGNGFEYDSEGNIIFVGKYKNWKKNGKGKEYFKNKLIFEGNYLNGKRNGLGIEYNFEGGKFVGEFKNGVKWDGTGYDENNEIEYEIIDGNGMIKEYYNGILIYEGNYSKGKRHGDGKEYDFLTGRLKYEGRFIIGHKFE